jgi:hypothetical protein
MAAAYASQAANIPNINNTKDLIFIFLFPPVLQNSLNEHDVFVIPTFVGMTPRAAAFM